MFIFISSDCDVHCNKRTHFKKIMTEKYRKVILNNLFLTFILAICGTILFSTILSNYYHHIFLLLLVVSLSLNLIIFRLAVIKNKVNQSFFLLVISFALKFFSYILITVIYFIYQPVLLYRVAYIFVLFIVFISFTSLEVKMLSKFFKTN
jgi:hypothetical protein